MSISLSHENVTVRLVRMRDAKAIERLLLDNRDWLRPWEATNPYAPLSFEMRPVVRTLLRNYDLGVGIPLVIEMDGVLVGQLNVSNIAYGSMHSATLGYWVSPAVAGRGVTPTAVALITDYLFGRLGLHRVAIEIRPENAASLRVVEKLGFRYEGLIKGHMHINNDWRDHYLFGLTAGEAAVGVLNRWLHNQVPNLQYPWKS
jgi:ribosomal-protein-alanine N-acetyltransferase